MMTNTFFKIEHLQENIFINLNSPTISQKIWLKLVS